MLRAKLLSKKLKVRLADTLIAQYCIDHHPIEGLLKYSGLNA